MLGDRAFELLMLAGLIACSPVQGALAVASQTYLYHPKISLALGRGFAPAELLEVKKPCIKFEQERLDQGPPRTEFSYQYVRSEQELYSALGYDFRASASYLGAKGDVGLKSTVTETFNTRTVNIVVKANTNFGRWGLKAGATLDGNAQALLADPVQFAITCGTSYVAIERRGAMVGAIVTASLDSDTFKRTFEASVGGGGSWGALSGEAKIAISRELRRASKQGRVDVRVTSSGGGGLGDLAEIVKSAVATEAGLDGIHKGLADYIAKFTADNAASVEYTSAPMTQFGWDASKYNERSLDYERLLRIAEQYDKINEMLLLIEQLKSTANPLRKALAPGTLSLVLSQEDNLLRWKRDTESAHRICLKPGDNLCNQYFDDSEPKKLKSEPPALPFLPYLFAPPVAKFEVPSLFGYPRKNTLSKDAVRVILNAPRRLRESVRKDTDPGGEVLPISLALYAPYPLVSKRVVLVKALTGEELDGVFIETLVSNPAAPGGHLKQDSLGWFVAATKDKGLLYSYDNETQIMKWATQNAIELAGKQEGTFMYVVRDIAGREWRIPFLKARWEVSNGKLVGDFQPEIVQ